MTGFWPRSEMKTWPQPSILIETRENTTLNFRLKPKRCSEQNRTLRRRTSMIWSRTIWRTLSRTSKESWMLMTKIRSKKSSGSGNYKPSWPFWQTKRLKKGSPLARMVTSLKKPNKRCVTMRKQWHWSVWRPRICKISFKISDPRNRKLARRNSKSINSSTNLSMRLTMRSFRLEFRTMKWWRMRPIPRLFWTTLSNVRLRLTRLGLWVLMLRLMIRQSYQT